jgi:hypothetical protein
MALALINNLPDYSIGIALFNGDLCRSKFFLNISTTTYLALTGPKEQKSNINTANIRI